jgi:hypothetical protein
MPAPKHPSRPEFFVYQLQVGDVPFYIGVGRAKRASDRVRYVKNLMKRESQGNLVDWDFSCAVVAELLRRGHEITVAYSADALTRQEALKREPEAILQLVTRGFSLANTQHNPQRLVTVREVALAVETRLRRLG